MYELGEQFLARLLAIIGSKGAAHEHKRTVADVPRDDFVGECRTAKILECRIYAVAEILRRVDERAVKVEYQQFKAVDRHRTKNPNHVSSVTGPAEESSLVPLFALLAERSNCGSSHQICRISGSIS